MIAAREKARAAKRGQIKSRVHNLVEPSDPRNADGALKILGIAAQDNTWADEAGEAGWLLLEPWAVQAALSRRRGGKRLDGSELKEIKRCTRDVEATPWPEDTE